MPDPFLEAKRRYRSEILHLIENYDENNRDSFSRLIESALDLGLKQPLIAEAFKVSDSTVSRWKSGKNIPMKMVRKVVAQQIGEMVAELPIASRQPAPAAH